MSRRAFVRPIRRFVLLLDDQPDRTEGGVVVNDGLYRCMHLDYLVVAVGELEDCDFGTGDTVVLAKPDAGRRVVLDGTMYRLVRVSDIIAVKES